jgi:purine-binding chemotaxis protein CheW
MKFKADQEYRFCIFYLDEVRYGLDVLAIREITRRLQVTPVRGSVGCVHGLLNLRGQIVTVLSPAFLLGLPDAKETTATSLLILKTTQELEFRGVMDYQTSEDLMGLWCERVSDVISVSGAEIKSPPASADGAIHPETMDGVIEVAEGLVRILNPGRLLQAGAAML